MRMTVDGEKGAEAERVTLAAALKSWVGNVLYVEAANPEEVEMLYNEVWDTYGQRQFDTDTRAWDSVAVLPFVNMSDDAQTEYFSDGMTDDLIQLLADEFIDLYFKPRLIFT